MKIRRGGGGLPLRHPNKPAKIQINNLDPNNFQVLIMGINTEFRLVSVTEVSSSVAECPPPWRGGSPLRRAGFGPSVASRRCFFVVPVGRRSPLAPPGFEAGPHQSPSNKKKVFKRWGKIETLKYVFLVLIFKYIYKFYPFISEMYFRLKWAFLKLELKVKWGPNVAGSVLVVLCITSKGPLSFL